MNLSKFVRKIVMDGEEFLFNTVTREIYPTDSKELPGTFISGNEADTISEYLLTPYKHNISLSIIPTWRCTLRCPHCFVIHQLSKNDAYDSSVDEKINLDKLGKFIEMIVASSKNSISIAVNLIGGEVLLVKEHTLEIAKMLRSIEPKIKKKIIISITTNLTTDLDDIDFEIFEEMDEIAVSIDGSPKYHDKARKIWKNSLNESPFIKTIRNIKSLKDRDLAGKIVVQAAAVEEFFLDKFEKTLFRTTMELLGVGRMFVGRIQETKSWKRNDNFQKPFGSRATMCCIWRCMSQFSIDSQGVYASYFDKDTSRLGDLDTNELDMIQNYQDWIKSKSPILHDDNCKQCPVVAFCWGQCNAGVEYRQNPSAICGKDKLEEQVKRANETGDLFRFAEFNDPLIQKIKKDAKANRISKS